LLHVVLPLASIVAAIRIYHAPVAILLVAGPVAIVALAVGPYLFASSMSLCSAPIPVIYGAIYHDHIVTLPSLLIHIDEHLLASLVIENEGCNTRDNSLHLFRLVLASAVLIDHLPAGPLELEPILGVLGRHKAVTQRVGLLSYVLQLSESHAYT
jgi:hypothetical protein